MALTGPDGLLSAGASVVPGGSLITEVVGSLIPSIGSKYTQATFVQRFVSAQQAGDDQSAGKLIDQAVFHSFPGNYNGSGGAVPYNAAPDASTWQGLLSAIYQQASVKWRGYADNRMSGSPALYDFVGSTVAKPSNINGVAPAPSGAAKPTGATIQAGGLGAKILDFFGLGPQNQAAIATQAGAAAGAQVQRGIVTAALIVGAVVAVVIIARRR